MAQTFNRKRWLSIHGLLSLPVWMVFSFICLTGSVAVISDELTWLVNPASRVAQTDNDQPVPLAKIISAVTSEYPGAQVTSITAREPFLTYAVNFTDDNRPFATAYVNQYTGALQAVYSDISFSEFMRSLHGWLLFPWQQGYSVGYYLVSAMSVVVLLAAISGMIIYRRFWTAFIRPQIRTRYGIKLLLHDLHRSGGVWALWFMLIMGVTGLWYLVQAICWHLEVPIEQEPAPLAAAALPQQQPLMNTFPTTADIAYQSVLQRFPQFTLSYVMLPEHNRDTYKFVGGKGDVFYDQSSYQMAVNPWSNETVHITEPANFGGLQTIMHIADKLHFGTLAGWLTKLIWFVFGLTLTAISVTGFYLWLVRQPAPKPATQKRSTIMIEERKA